MAEKKQINKFSSRKWITTVWAMAIVSVVIAICSVALFLDKEVPGGLIGIGTTLAAVPTAYIFGNSYQKTHTSPKNEVFPC